MRKKHWLLILNFTLSISVFSQDLSQTKVFAFTAALDTKINGVGLGLMINSLIYEGDTTSTIINGLNLEIIGTGLFGPLTASNPLVPNDVHIDNVEPFLDSLILDAKEDKHYKINGVSSSASGLAGHEIQVNGLNISGISTITSSTNGVSIATLMTINKVMHGLSIGLINQSLEHFGVQIGLFNSAKRTKGIQIGLWNKNEKRSLPFINWSF